MIVFDGGKKEAQARHTRPETRLKRQASEREREKESQNSVCVCVAERRQSEGCAAWW